MDLYGSRNFPKYRYFREISRNQSLFPEIFSSHSLKNKRVEEARERERVKRDHNSDRCWSRSCIVGLDGEGEWRRRRRRFRSHPDEKDVEGGRRTEREAGLGAGQAAGADPEERLDDPWEEEEEGGDDFDPSSGQGHQTQEG